MGRAALLAFSLVLPKERLSALHVNLVENIKRLKLDAERILPLHGRVVPAGELYRMAGKTP
jgi:hypothetical protein